MRKALSWRFFPPRDWVIPAILFYDKVIIADPHGDLGAEHEYGLRKITALRRELIETVTAIPEAFDFESMKLHVESLYDQVGPSRDRWVEMSDSEFQQLLDSAHSHIANNNPSVDFYNADGDTANQPPLLSTVQMLVPVEADKLSVAQITDFREANRLRLFTFQEEADSLIKRFREASTEQDAQDSLRLIEEAMQREFANLKRQCNDVNMDTVQKVLGIDCSAPAATVLIASLLHVPLLGTAAVIGAIAKNLVPIIMAREKAMRSIDESPWSYLWKVEKLVKNAR